MDQSPPPRPLEELIDTFNGLGSVILTSAEEFETFMEHVRGSNIPTQTAVDRDAGTVTVFRRAWGTLEGA